MLALPETDSTLDLILISWLLVTPKWTTRFYSYMSQLCFRPWFFTFFICLKNWYLFPLIYNVFKKYFSDRFDWLWNNWDNFLLLLVFFNFSIDKQHNNSHAKTRLISNFDRSFCVYKLLLKCLSFFFEKESELPDFERMFLYKKWRCLKYNLKLHEICKFVNCQQCPNKKVLSNFNLK